MTVTMESGQNLTASKTQPYRARTANPTITSGSPTAIKKISAPSRSKFESGCQDRTYRVNVAGTKHRTNAPIARSSASINLFKTNLTLRYAASKTWIKVKNPTSPAATRAIDSTF